MIRAEWERLRITRSSASLFFFHEFDHDFD